LDVFSVVLNFYGGTHVKEERFRKIIADVRKWIEDMLEKHEAQMESVLEANFERLGKYYSNSFLQRVQRVIVNKCPVPPLASSGIPELAEIENWDIKGIPWKNTVFIRRDLANWDAVHFHELLHIVQWECLGTESYLTAWAIGTITRGYRDNPLEEMAFRHQLRFETEEKPYDIVKEITKEISTWPESLFDIRKI
jgi:hypothetical protein